MIYILLAKGDITARITLDFANIRARKLEHGFLKILQKPLHTLKITEPLLNTTLHFCNTS